MPAQSSDKTQYCLSVMSAEPVNLLYFARYNVKFNSMSEIKVS